MPWLPDRYAARISEIPVAELYAEGVRGVIVDLDNTLVGYREQHPAPEVTAWVAAATAQGLKLVVVSNNVHAWVERIATHLKISFVHKAAKPLPIGFGKALQLLNTSRDQTIVIGDQFFTDVLGAKLFGLRVILTEPIVPHEHRVMRFIRRLERLIIRKRV